MSRTRTHHTKDFGTQYEGIFRCPHCDHENSHWFGLWAFRPEVICCDTENGGCDTYFTVTAVVDITVTVTPRKIEGIEREEPHPYSCGEDEEVSA